MKGLSKYEAQTTAHPLTALVPNHGRVNAMEWYPSPEIGLYLLPPFYEFFFIYEEKKLWGQGFSERSVCTTIHVLCLAALKLNNATVHRVLQMISTQTSTSNQPAVPDGELASKVEVSKRPTFKYTI